MQIRSMGKNPINYETVQKEMNTYEQKPINIDDFNNHKEDKVQERVNKQKAKRREIAENNKLLKKKQRSEQNKVQEKDMWERLAQLNTKFKNIKKPKKEAKKTPETVIIQV